MAQRPRRFGRYLLFESFARGGMASVCFGRVIGPVGFSRVVAIKRHHSHLLKDPDFVSMMIDEARLAGRIRHPSVVPVLDLVQLERELLLVMEYVDGLSLAKIWRQALETGEPIPPRIATTIVGAVLQGLHAAHEMRDDRGELAGIVHRDVSPQNVLVGRDGLARVTDFGIALARERLQFTRTEEIKGKLEYMAPEQLRRDRVDRRADVYAASLVLWELLTRRRPFVADTDRTVMSRIVSGEIPSVCSLAPNVPEALDALVMRGLSRHPTERCGSALEMARELERVVGTASQLEVAQWLERVVGDELERRAARVAEIEAWREEPSALPPDETLAGDVETGSDGPTRVSSSDVGSAGATSTRSVRQAGGDAPPTRPVLGAEPGAPATVPTGLDSRPPPTAPMDVDSRPPPTTPMDDSRLPPTSPMDDVDPRLPPTRPMIEVARGTRTLTATTAVEVGATEDAGYAPTADASGGREPGPTTDTRAATVRSVRQGLGRERLVWLLPIGAFLLGAALLGVVALTRLVPSVASVESADAPASPVIGAASSPQTVVGLAEPAADAAPVPDAAAGSVPSAAPSPATAAPWRTRTAPTVTSKPSPTGGTPKPPPKAASAACNPPYTVDSQGVRVPKPECFGR